MRAQSLGRGHLLSLIPDCSLLQLSKQDIWLIIVIWISSILWIMLWTLYRNFHKLLFRYWWLELATKASTTMKQQIYFLNLMLQVLHRYLSCWGPSFLMSSFPSLKLSQSKSKSKSKVRVQSLRTWSDSILLCHPPTTHHPPQKLFSATRHPIELKFSQ